MADAALDAGFIVNAPRPDVLRLAPPLIVTAAQLDSFVAALPGLLGPDRGSMTLRHFLADDDLTRRRAGGRCWTWPTPLKADPFKISPLAGPRSVALLFDKPTLRTQASFSAGIAELGGFPMIVDGRLARIGRAGVGRRHRPGARPAVRRDRLADLRPGPDRGDGRVRRGAGDQRADRRVPPLPGPGRPA